MSTKTGEPLVNNFQIPPWAGRPQAGLHLDVMKDGKLIQKLMIDEKKCYFFGRNRQLCDFPVDHASCSRVHSALVWHKHLNRPFIIDLGSIHGTYIGHLRLDSEKPQQVPIDSELRFGASTRVYVIRERPGPGTIGNALEKNGALGGSGVSGGDNPGGSSYWSLPETERELDNLTEFNTAHNRRIASMTDIVDTPSSAKPSKKRSYRVSFSELDDLINPEDIDPTIGRFRNLVQETFIPNKRSRMYLSMPDDSVAVRHALSTNQEPHHHKSALHSPPAPGEFNQTNSLATSSLLGLGSFSLASKLGLSLPNLAPDVDVEIPVPKPSLSTQVIAVDVGPQPPSGPEEPRKKKYAKEAWPGKRPGFLVAPPS